MQQLINPDGSIYGNFSRLRIIKNTYFHETQAQYRTSYKNLEGAESAKPILRNHLSFPLFFILHHICSATTVIIAGCSYVPTFLIVYQHWFAFSGTYF